RRAAPPSAAHGRRARRAAPEPAERGLRDLSRGARRSVLPPRRLSFGGRCFASAPPGHNEVRSALSGLNSPTVPATRSEAPAFAGASSFSASLASRRADAEANAAVRA